MPSLSSNIRKIIATLALAAAMASTAVAAPPSIKARLDSAHVLMGRLTGLNLEVVTDKGVKGTLPIFSTAGSDGIVRVNGDSVELRSTISVDTTELGSGRIQLNYKIPVQAFDSGMYRLPQFIFVAGRDTARSNVVTLKVIPLSVSDTEQIADYLGVEEGEKGFWDFVPDVFVYYWWAFLAGFLIILLLIWGLARRSRQQPAESSRPVASPYEIAIERLRALKERKLWEQGQEREYFTRLTEILRIYLQDRFGINAMEMTSDQIIAHLSESSDVRDKRDYVRRVLSMADFVKFAKMRPLPADNVEAYDNAVRFVEETRPVESDESDEDDNTDDSDTKTGKEDQR